MYDGIVFPAFVRLNVRRRQRNKMSTEKMKNIRCIALDLDGTTLSDSKAVSGETRRALEDAIARGIHVVVASGRALETIPPSVTSIEGIEYAITSNGAAVYRLEDKCCLRRVMLGGTAVDKILEITEGYFCSHEAFIQGVPYGQREYVEAPVRFGAMPQAVSYIQSTRKPVEDIHQFIREHREELDGMDLIVGKEEDRQSIREQLRNCGEKIYITSSVKNRIELASPEAGKASGLSFLLNELGIRPEEAAAFGDADNDIDMIKLSGCGIAVANATESCKAAADFLTKSNKEDGVAWAVREILGIRPGMAEK